MDDNSLIVPCEIGKGRKRPVQKENWKRLKLQAKRLKPKGLPEYPRCRHGKNSFLCKDLTMMDIQQFHKLIYSCSSKIEQDILILKFCEGIKPKRDFKKKKSVSIKYYVQKNNGTRVRVCKVAFHGITLLGPFRIERLTRNIFLKGETPKEKRGGDRIKDKNDQIKESIKHFIESLTCAESHYRRSHTTRLYLPCHLNFKKLYDIYCERNKDQAVRLCYFRNYVNRNYNLAFGTPLTDACSTCLLAKDNIAKATSAETKSQLIVAQRVHVLKAKAFYGLLKNTEEDVQIFAFDCQKNLALPKLPDQSAYFCQQINLYNFTIVCGNSKCKLSAESTKSFVWLETEFPKNSNAIASAVHNVLVSYKFQEKISKVQLFADGCGGQNKNTTLMSMLAYWLAMEAPAHIKNLEIVFPIVGHSFLPPDRVFGLVEKQIKKQNVIIDRQEYEDIIGKYSTVLKLTNCDNQWEIFDWKTEATKVLKKPGLWHFKFNESKRFIFAKTQTNNATIQGEVLYKSNLGAPCTVTKKKRKIADMKPKKLKIINSLKGDKSSIDILLKKHFGNEWRSLAELEFYKIIDKDNTEAGSSKNNEKQSDGEYMSEEEEPVLRI